MKIKRAKSCFIVEINKFHPSSSSDSRKSVFTVISMYA